MRQLKEPENKPVKELATNPLLLTLLFEESDNLRAAQYEEGIDLLLKKWNKLHRIEREQVYKQLSPKRKEDLLSQIAWTAFYRGKYFLPQK